MPSVYGARAGGARLERMMASPRYSGGVFRNTARVSAGLQPGSRWSTVAKFLFGGERRTPPAPLPSLDPRPRWHAPVETGLRVTWLGHSTLLLEIDGLRILTDPVWGERASPFAVAGPRRFQPVPVPIAALPPLDLVLVSHDHYDHLDYPSIQELARRDVPFVTALGVGAHLESWGVRPERITELDWWEEAALCGGRITVAAAPAQHFSGRSMSDRNRTLWASWALATERHRAFFSGDTGMHPELADIGRRLGPFDLVMLEVGAWHPSWGHVHLGPANALVAHRMLGGGTFLPIHWGTFNLALHAWDEPAETLYRLSQEQGVALVTPRLGAPIEPALGIHAEPWWREVGARRPVIAQPEIQEIPATADETA